MLSRRAIGKVVARELLGTRFSDRSAGQQSMWSFVSGNHALIPEIVTVNLIVNGAYPMIHVHALLEIAPDRINEYLTIHQALIPQILQEEGCAEYLLAIDAPTAIDIQRQAGSEVVSVIEKWETVSAFETHLNAPHVVDFRQRVEGLLLNATAYILEPV